MRGQGLKVQLGPFQTRIRSSMPEIEKAVSKLYGAFQHIDDERPSHFDTGVSAPNFFRRHIRRQAYPDVGFDKLMQPLPAIQAALALEMGLNLQVALKNASFTTFHAASIGIGEGSYLFPAQSGSGKSTMTAGLVLAGYQHLSDEFGLLDPATGMVVPYPRPISLKNESVEIIDKLGGVGCVSIKLDGTPKGRLGYLPPNDAAIAGISNHKIPRAVIFPFYSPGATADRISHTNADAVMKLILSSSNYELMGERAFDALTSMGSKIKAFDIRYPDLASGVKLVEEIATEMGDLP